MVCRSAGEHCVKGHNTRIRVEARSKPYQLERVPEEAGVAGCFGIVMQGRLGQFFTISSSSLGWNISSDGQLAFYSEFISKAILNGSVNRCFSVVVPLCIR